MRILPFIPCKQIVIAVNYVRLFVIVMTIGRNNIDKDKRIFHTIYKSVFLGDRPRPLSFAFAGECMRMAGACQRMFF